MKSYFLGLINLSSLVLVLYILYLFIEFWHIRRTKAFEMDAAPLPKQHLFRSAIRIPLVSFIIFGGCAWWGRTPNLSAEGFQNFLELSKLPLGLLSLSIPFAAIVTNMHRTIQTDEQIREARKKNLSDLFHSHQKNTIEYFESKINLTMLAGSAYQNTQEERVLTVKSPYKLYKKMFPNASAQDNDFAASEKFKKEIISVWQRVNYIIKQENATKYGKRPPQAHHAKMINSLELATRKITRIAYLNRIKFRYNFYIATDSSYFLRTGLQNTDDLKKFLSLYWQVCNDIFLIANETPLKKSHFPHLHGYLNSNHMLFVLPVKMGVWDHTTLDVMTTNDIYRAKFVGNLR
ncbi:hypothetical protein [Cronobacter sakazakii]|uniref:hypothetical protein n=1 Tax=Cronobacter sakazakii TaxID=28141 RepID=UPI001F51148F|nr:hypothetical protein [Cronobacter sakazakii]MCI0324650.1 hypothetical protein [Cronobacter sakazakii]